MLTPFQKKIDQETAAVLKNSLKILILILNLLFVGHDIDSQLFATNRRLRIKIKIFKEFLKTAAVS